MKYLLLLVCMAVSFHSGRCFSNEKLCEDGIKAVSSFGDGQWTNFLGMVLIGPCHPFFFYIDKKKCNEMKSRIAIAHGMLKASIAKGNICKVLFPNIYINENSVQDFKNSGLCMGCKVVVAAIEFEVKALNYSIEEVVKGVQTLCKLLAPFKIQVTLCNDITNFIKEIIQWVLSGASPGDICERLKLCTSTNITNGINGKTEENGIDNYPNLRQPIKYDQIPRKVKWVPN